MSTNENRSRVIDPSLAQLSREHLVLGLRAVKTVALADQRLAPEEKALLSAAAESLQLQVDVEALEPITPEALAGEVSSPWLRKRVVQALIVTAMVDQHATEDEVELVGRFARALGIEDPYVKTLAHVAKNQLIRLRIDFLRRSFLPRQLEKGWDEAGLAGVRKFLAPFTGSTDSDGAWRYKQLGLLAEGTLGRTFWQHMTKNRFGFPGEPHALSEAFARHDMVHTLTGYGTDPLGELEVAAFTATMSGEAGTFVEDPFFFVFSSIIIYHMGVKVRPLFPPYEGHLDVKGVVRALERGSAARVDLMSERWDFWSEVELSLDEVREKHNIVPI